MHKMLYVILALVVLSTVACSLGGSSSSISVSEPKAAVAPIALSSALTTMDVCQTIPQEDMQALMGRKLSGDPQRFEFYDTTGTNGCMFDGGKNADKEAFYAYVVFTPLEVYNNQPLYMDVAVSGIGESAYFNNGGDTRQLWVKVNDNVAFVVANGDVAHEDGLKALARLIVAAIR